MRCQFDVTLAGRRLWHGVFPDRMNDRGAALAGGCGWWSESIAIVRACGKTASCTTASSATFGSPLSKPLLRLVSANMVVGPIAEPEVRVKNLNRILKPSGLFIFRTPNQRHYQARLVSWLPQRMKDTLAKHLEIGKRKTFSPLGTA